PSIYHIPSSWVKKCDRNKSNGQNKLRTLRTLSPVPVQVKEFLGRVLRGEQGRPCLGGLVLLCCLRRFVTFALSCEPSSTRGVPKMPTNIALFILMSLFLFSAGPASAQTSVKPAATAPESAAAPTQQEVNKALATRFYNEVWFSRNPDVVDEIIAPNYTIHDIGDNKGLTEPEIG